jgi:hypothetical protein
MQDAVAARRAPLPVMLKEHETPLIVWSSKTGPRKDPGTISPALLPHQIVTSAGLSDPFYTGFLGKIAAHYSVIDRYMLVDAEGSAHPGWQDGRKAAPPSPPGIPAAATRHDLRRPILARTLLPPAFKAKKRRRASPVAALPQSPGCRDSAEGCHPAGHRNRPCHHRRCGSPWSGLLGWSKAPARTEISSASSSCQNNAEPQGRAKPTPSLVACAIPPHAVFSVDPDVGNPQPGGRVVEAGLASTLRAVTCGHVLQRSCCHE